MPKLLRCIKNYFFCKKYPFWKLTDTWYDYNTSINDGRKGTKNFFVKYAFTWYDDVPKGWQKAFGKQLSKELLKVGKAELKRLSAEGKKVGWADILTFEQIKEKWGELCLYASATSALQDVLQKYETLSQGYCINCGRPARYVSKGWVEFYCEKCFDKYLDTVKENQRVPLLDACRLTKEDIPEISNISYETLKTETYKNEDECNKRFDELWDSADRPKDMVYSKIESDNHEYQILHKRVIEHRISIKEKYGIDLEKLWGLKSE